MNARAMGVFAVIVSLCGGLAACDAFEDDCACTLEYRMNICVTVNGEESIPDSLGFLREKQDGARDSLDAHHTRCFGEMVGTQRVLMLRDGAVIDSSEWFTTRVVDCCHGEARTIDFVADSLSK